VFEPEAAIRCSRKLDDSSSGPGSFGGDGAATAEKSKDALKETLGMRHIEERVMALDVISRTRRIAPRNALEMCDSDLYYITLTLWDLQPKADVTCASPAFQFLELRERISLIL
jgi:hypothetical protein